MKWRKDEFSDPCCQVAEVKIRSLSQQICVLGHMRAGLAPEQIKHIRCQEWITERRKEEEVAFLECQKVILETSFNYTIVQ